MSNPTAILHVVPIASDGLEGWSSCCSAAVTFSGDGALCCKACWHEVQPIPLVGDHGDVLSAIVTDVLTMATSPDEGVARQHALLKAIAVAS